MYQEALRINPQDAKAQRQVLIAHGFLGELYFNQNQYNEALTHLNATIEWNREDMGALYIRGIILNKMGDKEAALTDWKRSCDLGYIDSCMIYNAQNQR
jgi:Flp pilus assembly protein TadD